MIVLIYWEFSLFLFSATALPLLPEEGSGEEGAVDKSGLTQKSIGVQ
jgi:hypothetical protein